MSADAATDGWVRAALANKRARSYRETNAAVGWDAEASAAAEFAKAPLEMFSRRDVPADWRASETEAASRIYIESLSK